MVWLLLLILSMFCTVRSFSPHYFFYICCKLMETDYLICLVLNTFYTVYIHTHTHTHTHIYIKTYPSFICAVMSLEKLYKKVLKCEGCTNFCEILYIGILCFVSMRTVIHCIFQLPGCITAMKAFGGPKRSWNQPARHVIMVIRSLCLPPKALFCSLAVQHLS